MSSSRYYADQKVIHERRRPKIADKDVVIYTTPACRKCQLTKEYFSQKGISFVEHNVAQDKFKSVEMFLESGQTKVPVTIIDDEIVIGFDQDRLNELLSG